MDADTEANGDLIIGYGENTDASHEDILKVNNIGVTFEGATNNIYPVAGTPGLNTTIDYVESIAVLICEDPTYTCLGQPFIVDVIATPRQMVFTKGILTSNP